ncbi:MAG: hypothetical protein GC151_14215 [Betaproteobacteria bacterium]|nr:hypothetical protein [Betaproteobacteria bacterium]
MKRFLTCLLLTVSCAAMPVHAEFVSTKRFEGWLQEAEKTGGSFKDRTLALGFVMGIHDFLEHTHVCTPSGLQANQLLRVIHGWMRGNESLWTVDAARTVQRALEQSYPCPPGGNASAPPADAPKRR